MKTVQNNPNCRKCRFAVPEGDWYRCTNSKQKKKIMVRSTDTCKYGEPKAEPLDEE